MRIGFEMTIPPIIFLVSVIQEGQAIIDHLRLTELPSEGHPLFADGDGRAYVLVTGIGPAAASDALDSIIGDTRIQSARWINIGISGHATHSINSFFQVSEVIPGDAVTGIVLPGQPIGAFKTERLRTYPQFVEDYPDSGLVDMEAHAIAQRLQEHGLLESFQAFKLVSDNQEENALSTTAGKRALGAELSARGKDILKLMDL